MRSKKRTVKKGRLFVVSAPSGSGKTTLCDKLILSLSGKRKLVRSISVTTRKPRRNEREGVDYFFVSTEEFMRRRGERQFLEWAKVLGHFYGTPADFVKMHTNRGNNVLLSIDVQGAMQIKRKVRNAIFIFILAPSLGELAKRLRRRSTDSQAAVGQRLKLAKREMGFIKDYNYVVLNDKINKALARLKEIINLEKGGRE